MFVNLQVRKNRIFNTGGEKTQLHLRRADICWPAVVIHVMEGMELALGSALPVGSDA